jgi:hypothetical protein
MIEDGYEKERAKWTLHRLKIFDEIEEKLAEMKKIAVYARDNKIDAQETEELNKKISQLGNEVQALYEKNKNFWIEWQ